MFLENDTLQKRVIDPLNISNGSYPIYEIFNDIYIVNKDDEKNFANNWLNAIEDEEVENTFNEFKEYYPTDPNIHFLYMEFEGTKLKLK